MEIEFPLHYELTLLILFILHHYFLNRKIAFQFFFHQFLVRNSGNRNKICKNSLKWM